MLMLHSCLRGNSEIKGSFKLIVFLTMTIRNDGLMPHCNILHTCILFYKNSYEKIVCRRVL